VKKVFRKIKKGMIVTTVILSLGCASAPRKWHSEEVILATLSTGAAAWNYSETEKALDRGAHEMNPLYGEHPSDTKLAVCFGITQAATLALAHYLPTVTLPLFGECELRIPLLLGKTALNTGLALHDHGVNR